MESSRVVPATTPRWFAAGAVTIAIAVYLSLHVRTVGGAIVAAVRALLP